MAAHAQVDDPEVPQRARLAAALFRCDEEEGLTLAEIRKDVFGLSLSAHDVHGLVLRLWADGVAITKTVGGVRVVLLTDLARKRLAANVTKTLARPSRRSHG